MPSARCDEQRFLKPDGDEDEGGRVAKRPQHADALPARRKNGDVHQQHGGNKEAVERERHRTQHVLHVIARGARPEFHCDPDKRLRLVIRVLP
jgi:hypothetical protein